MPSVLVKNKFLWLLLSLFAFFVITPFIVSSEIDLYIYGMLFTVILYVSAFVITHNRWLIVTGIVLASLVFIGLWINTLFVANRTLLGFEYFLMAIYFLMITVVVLRSVLSHRKITFNTICGAVCGYLLIGMLWSFVYGLIYFFHPNAFNFEDLHPVFFDSNFQRFSYYSFVTLTTLGYGDITPMSNVARTFAWIEAIVGQVYLTVWIAQLVALHVTQHSKKKG